MEFFGPTVLVVDEEVAQLETLVTNVREVVDLEKRNILCLWKVSF